MKGLMRFLKPYRLQCVLAPLFKMLEALFELLVPLAVRVIVDRGIGGGDAGLIVRMVLLMTGLALVGLISSVTAQYFSARAATGFATQVRRALFRKLQSLSFPDMDEMGTSTMITRMTSDVNQAQTGINMTLRLALRSPFVVFGAMVMAFTIDIRTARIFAITIAILLVAVSALMAVNIPMMNRVQQALERVLGATRENLSGARVIRAFCQEERQEREFAEKNSLLTRRQRRAGLVSGLMNPATYLIINLAIVFLIRRGALQVQSGVLSRGQVVALYNYMGQILVELIKLANLVVTMNRGWASWKRIDSVLRKEPSMAFVPDGQGTLRADEAVRFDDVSLSYNETGDAALTGISFTALKGQTIGIIGGTGSGKTSVVGLIPRFYDATSGTVYVDGTDVRLLGRDDLRRRIGFVLQKAVLFKGSIRDNLRWGREDADDAALADAVRLAQAEDIVAAKGGLDAQIEQGGRNLSGGQRQRLTIARALVRRPEILILDDSASALDQATDRRLRLAIRSLDYRPTVFIVSQRTASIRDADQILVLDDGRAVGLGTHAYLMENCPVYREIHESQYGREEASA
ncbi:MAG: ABC transporter ATP-binding protein [Clostridia bacterium]|nr:ABC transporter ATP-binding protein [Clostridia bacterium]